MGTVTLGGITFDPGPRRDIQFGGNQALIAQNVPGAGPTYQDMGSDEDPVSWDGSFDGPDSVATALRLDEMRRAGQPVDLVTGLVPTRRVRIREFKFRVRRADKVDYDIQLVLEGGIPDWTPPPAAESSPAGATPAATGRHIVVAGDTLYALAQRYLGNGDLWPAIAKQNGITDPRTLQIGQELIVPSQAEAPALSANYKTNVTQQNIYVKNWPARPLKVVPL